MKTLEELINLFESIGWKKHHQQRFPKGVFVWFKCAEKPKVEAVFNLESDAAHIVEEGKVSKMGTHDEILNIFELK